MFRSSVFNLVANHLAATTEPKDDPILYVYHPYVCEAIMNRPKTLNAGNLESIQLFRREIKKGNQMPDLKVRALSSLDQYIIFTYFILYNSHRL